MYENCCDNGETMPQVSTRCRQPAAAATSERGSCACAVTPCATILHGRNRIRGSGGRWPPHSNDRSPGNMHLLKTPHSASLPRSRSHCSCSCTGWGGSVKYRRQTQRVRTVCRMWCNSCVVSAVACLIHQDTRSSRGDASTCRVGHKKTTLSSLPHTVHTN